MAAVTDESLSPAACLDPSQSLQNRPWQNATAPLAQLKLKALVITGKAASELRKIEHFEKILYWLNAIGFTLYVAQEDDGRPTVKRITFPLAHKPMDNLCDFSSADDFEQLAVVYQAPRDSVCVIDGKLMEQLWKSAHLDNGTTAFASVTACDMIIFKSEVAQIIEKNPRKRVIQRAEIESENEPVGDGYDFIRQMRRQRDPQQRLSLFKRHEVKITDVLFLSHCIALLPREASVLLEQHKDLIRGGCDLVCCLHFCPDLQNQLSLLKTHESKIKSGLILAGCMSCCLDDKIKLSLLKKHKQLISTAEQLAKCMKACPDKHTKILLLEEFKHMILNGHDLALCMMACPDNARKKSLFDEFKDKIKTA